MKYEPLTKEQSAELAAVVAEALHHEAHDNCFIARSVNFPVSHEVTIRSETRQ